MDVSGHLSYLVMHYPRLKMEAYLGVSSKSSYSAIWARIDLILHHFRVLSFLLVYLLFKMPSIVWC